MIPTEAIVQAYKETGSVWAAGKRLGLAGQSVHERLRAVGYPMRGRLWTPDELAELATLAGQATIGEIAHRLGRPYAGVALMISRRGFGSRYGNRLRRKLPRGAGYDKDSIGRALRELARFSGSIRQFCVQRGLTVDGFVYACQCHYPDKWTAYTATHSDIPRATCPYCGAEFYPMSRRQTHCTRRCGATAKKDAAYFGGKRRHTIGLPEGICQLCGEYKPKGLSSHHLLGKDNDPDNEALVALCPGCHQLVGILAGRKFTDETTGWENLINLAMIRRQGTKTGERVAVSTFVEIEWLSRADLEDEAEEPPALLPPA